MPLMLPTKTKQARTMSAICHAFSGQFPQSAGHVSQNSPSTFSQFPSPHTRNKNTFSKVSFNSYNCECKIHRTDWPGLVKNDLVKIFNAFPFQTTTSSSLLINLSMFCFKITPMQYRLYKLNTVSLQTNLQICSPQSLKAEESFCSS